MIYLFSKAQKVISTKKKNVNIFSSLDGNKVVGLNPLRGLFVQICMFSPSGFSLFTSSYRKGWGMML